MRFVIAVLAIALAWPAAAQDPSESVSGPAYPVDGESLFVGKTEVRLFGINAPAFNEPLGREARVALDDLVLGREVSCSVFGTDQAKRAVARCAMASGTDPAERLLEAGLATVDRAAAAGSEVAQRYNAMERHARDLKRGLWRTEVGVPFGQYLGFLIAAVSGASIAFLSHYLAGRRQAETHELRDQAILDAFFVEVRNFAEASRRR